MPGLSISPLFPSSHPAPSLPPSHWIEESIHKFLHTEEFTYPQELEHLFVTYTQDQPIEFFNEVHQLTPAYCEERLLHPLIIAFLKKTDNLTVANIRFCNLWAKKNKEAHQLLADRCLQKFRNMKLTDELLGRVSYRVSFWEERIDYVTKTFPVRDATSMEVSDRFKVEIHLAYKEYHKALPYILNQSDLIFYESSRRICQKISQDPNFNGLETLFSLLRIYPIEKEKFGRFLLNAYLDKENWEMAQKVLAHVPMNGDQTKRNIRSCKSFIDEKDLPSLIPCLRRIRLDPNHFGDYIALAGKAIDLALELNDLEVACSLAITHDALQASLVHALIRLGRIEMAECLAETIQDPQQKWSADKGLENFYTRDSALQSGLSYGIFGSTQTNDSLED